MTQIRINKLEVEWDGDGCVAMASGFSGVMLTCPRCQELLPRDVEHRCGDKVLPPVKNCRFCGQPMKPKGVRKRPDEYDHAQGCPYSRPRAKRKMVKGEALLRRRIGQKRGKA